MTSSQPLIRYIIIRGDGSPLTMHGGETILFETESMALAWLQEGERVVPASAGIEGALSMQEGEHGSD